jgi:hypothetical protein
MPTDQETQPIANAPADKEPKAGLTKEQIAEIRALRAETNPETTGPVHSHAALAKRFGTTPGSISHIVRNLTHKDPTYTPTHDGNRRPVPAT